MSVVAEQVEVRAPVDTIFACWSRVESFPTFMAGVDAVQRIDSGRTRWVTSIAGVRRAFEAVLTSRIEDQYVAWETAGGDVSHHGAVRFEPVSDGATRVDVHLVWEPLGVLERAACSLGLDRRQVRADLRRFKELVETEPLRAAAIGGKRR